MATIKAYTDLEQSKKLAEILPPDSADMVYIATADDVIGDTLYTAEYKTEIIIKEGDTDYINCWSLAALLSVLPNKIVSHETAFEGEDAKGITDIYYKCIESTEDDRYMCRYVGNGYMYECVADNPIDTCYEMILKLHESKIL